MNENIRNKLTEVVATNNVAYLLKENNDFSVTGYKVMSNQIGIGLLPCAKLMYNGKIKLVYMIGYLKPLSFAVTRLGVNELSVIVINLLQRAMDIQSNGFFKAENLELEYDKIFVDMSDYSVHFIYYPVIGGNTGSVLSFDSEFRLALIDMFNSFPVFAAPQFQRLCSDLSNGSMTLDQVFKRLQEKSSESTYEDDGKQGSYGQQAERSQQNHGPQLADNSYGQQMGGYSQEGSGQHQGGYSQQGGYFQQNNGQNKDFFQQNGGYQQGYGGVQGDYKATPSNPQPPLTIQSIGSPVQINLTVKEPEYLIGKSPTMVNGAITHNPAISRLHCKISYTNGSYYLTDLGSANGTFLNQSRLNKQETRELHTGDYIKLANSDFIVSF